QESARMQQLIERLLHLAQVEQRQGLEEQVAVPLQALVASLLQRFVANIEQESARMQQLIERLLHLAQVEQRQGLEEQVAVP
ncbi:two-component system sensor histidine kinase CreC, partial [Klebsiella pneumoniae]